MRCPSAPTRATVITAMAEHAMSHIPPAAGYDADVTSRAKASKTST